MKQIESAQIMNARKRVSSGEKCSDHAGHDAILSNHEKMLSDCHDAHVSMWDAIKEKVPFRLFSLLVLLVVGNLGFQMAIYTLVKDTQTAVAVIKAELKTHAIRGNRPNARQR